MIAALLGLTLLAQGAEPVGSPAYLDRAAVDAARSGPNGYADFLAAAAIHARQPQTERDSALAADRKIGTTGAETRDGLAIYRNDVRSLAPAFARIRLGLAKPVRYPGPTPTAATLHPELSHFKGLARGFVRLARVCLADGDPSRAADALHDGLEFSRRIAISGRIHALVSLANETILLRAAAADAHRLTTTGRDRLDAWARKTLSGPSPLIATSAVERASQRESFFDFMERPEGWLATFDDMEAEDRTQIARALTAVSGVERERLYRAFFARLERPFLSLEARLRTPEARWLEPVEEAPSESDSEPMPRFDLPPDATRGLFIYIGLLKALGAEADPTIEARNAARARVRLRLLRAHLAIESFTSRTGRLPKTLAELPGLLRRDPATSLPYSYVRTSPTAYRLSAPSPILGETTLMSPREDAR